MPSSDFIYDVIHLETNLEKNCFRLSDAALVFLKFSEKGSCYCL